MKARTKAAKRAGRKRKLNIERQPNGQPARSVSEAKENAQLTAVAARMRLFGADKAEAMRPEMGHVLGRLYLDKRNGISLEMYQAGLRMGEEYSRYYGLCGVPFPSARAQDLFRLGGDSGDITDCRGPLHNRCGQCQACKARKARNDAQAIELVLAIDDIAGCPIRTVTKRVVIEDRDEGLYQRHMLGHLRKGLKALVKHYGIEAGTRARAA